MIFKTLISILLRFQWQVTITEKDILHSNVSDEIETLCGSILIYTNNLCCEYLMAVLDIFFTYSFPSLSRFVIFWYNKYPYLWRYIGSCVKSNNKTIILKLFIIWCFCILYYYIWACRYMYLKINVYKFPCLKFDTCLYFEHNQVFTIEWHKDQYWHCLIFIDRIKDFETELN